MDGIVTDATLIVKHLKPTRLITTKQHVTKQEKTLHARVGFLITAIASTNWLS
jgi:hypothetical protein